MTAKRFGADSVLHASEDVPAAVKQLNAGRLADKVVVLVCDAQHPPQPTANAAPATLAFFDAPYASGLTAPALTALRGHGWIASGTCCVVEMGAEEAFAAPPGFRLVDERAYGAARVLFLAAP